MFRSIQRGGSRRRDTKATVIKASMVSANRLSRFFIPAVVCICLVVFVAGCGTSSPTVDTGPFESAVATYLKKNDMALKLKAIKEGPVVTGETATMTASMTHADLGGPSVEWRFRFERTDGEDWVVVGHGD